MSFEAAGWHRSLGCTQPRGAQAINGATHSTNDYYYYYYCYYYYYYYCYYDYATTNSTGSRSETMEREVLVDAEIGLDRAQGVRVGAGEFSLRVLRLYLRTAVLRVLRIPLPLHIW